MKTKYKYVIASIFDYKYRKTNNIYFLRPCSRKVIDENIMSLWGELTVANSLLIKDWGKYLKKYGKRIYIRKELHEMFQSKDSVIAEMGYNYIIEDYENKI